MAAREDTFETMPARPRIAWVGAPYFQTSLAELTPEFNAFIFYKPLLTWETICEQAGFEPDLLVYADRSIPPPLAGLEDYPCATCFICVDSHIHGWYPVYAQAFDLVTVSLRDHMPEFAGKRLPRERLRWLPPFARNEDRPKDVPAEWDLAFVGNVDPETMPGRARFLDEVGRLVPGLVVTSGVYRDLFPRARLVLNIAERGDLNYRVFEALGCGACLLTPRIGHGLSDLFEDGVDLFTYPPGDAKAVAELARRLLSEPETRARVAASGFAKVDAEHRAVHRARQLVEWASSFDLAALAAERRATSAVLREEVLKLLYLHHAESIEDAELRRAYLSLAMGDTSAANAFARAHLDWMRRPR